MGPLRDYRLRGVRFAASATVSTGNRSSITRYPLVLPHRAPILQAGPLDAKGIERIAALSEDHRAGDGPHHRGIFTGERSLVKLTRMVSSSVLDWLNAREG